MESALAARVAVGMVIAASPLLAPLASRADPAPAPRISCTITDPRITEASGLAVSRNRLFVANDGGTSVTVFELGATCAVVRVWHNATDPYDVEDLARTPDGRLWLADTGDNREARETVALEVLDPSGGLVLYRLAYPDGPHDAEALLLDHAGRPYLVTKNSLGSSGVYTPDAALAAGRTTPLRRVTSLRFLPTGTPGGPVSTVSQVLVTGGAVAPDGRRVALRTYTDLYLWTVGDGDIGAALRDGEPARVALPEEEQGEAVTFTPDGHSVLTVSEGSPVPVRVVPLPSVSPADSRPSATASSTERTRNQAEHSDEPKDEPKEQDKKGNSRPLWVNLAISALVATVVVGGMGRLRRHK